MNPKEEVIEMKTEPPPKATSNQTSSYLKYWSLIILAVQNTGLIISMRYARTRKGDMFLSSTAVVMSELSKLTACLFLTFLEIRDIRKWISFLYENIIADMLTTLKVAVPAFVYVLQNNLQYIAVSNLDAATFQVTYQLKILTTALFSVFILKRSLSKLKWFSLFLLFIGVALVQLRPDLLKQKATSTNSQNSMTGLFAVLMACLCSGFAGVYFEKILKGPSNKTSSSPKSNSIWLRNIQLGLLGFILGICGMLLNDGPKVIKNGFFFGYNLLVCWVIFIQAFGGLVVAVVVKYADNILKGFATSFAIILSCIVSIFLFDFILSIQFMIGTGLVLLSNYLYSLPAK